MGTELAMMDLATGKYLVLDEIATEIWAILEAPQRVEDLIATLQERYDVSPERCETDILALLEDLHDKGLVNVIRP